jgi:hypothetical protein
MAIPPNNDQYRQQVFEATKRPDGTFDEKKFMDKIEDDLIARGNTDILLQRIPRAHIAEIQATQSLVETQKFFNCVEKIQRPEEKGSILGEAFGVFSKVHDLQWIALEVAKKHNDKDGYLFNLIDACRTTKNKEVALQAANEISHPARKAKYLAKINYSNYIDG